MADEVTPLAATIVTVQPAEPYPTGTPAVTNMANVHDAQERVAGPTGKYNNPFERQSVQNLAAGGMISGGAAGT